MVSYEEGTRPECPACGYGSAPPAPPASTPPPNGNGEGSRRSGKAVASLVLGVCSLALFPVGFIPAVLAIVLGSVAVHQVGADPAVHGRRMAVAGIWLGISYFIVAVVALAVAVFILVYDGP